MKSFIFPNSGLKNKKNFGVYASLINWLDSHGAKKIKIIGDNVMCTCPLHREKHPSFGVLIDQQGLGTFQCYACGRKGTITSLIKFLEGPNVNAREFRKLLSEGSPVLDSKKAKSMKVELLNLKGLDDSVLQEFNYDCQYWGERGIQKKSVELFKLGMDPKSWSVTIPLRKVESTDLVGVCLRYWDTHPNFPLELKERMAKGDAQKYRYVTGSIPSISIFGQETFRSFSEPIYIFEGAIDAINFWQVTGCQVASKWGNSLTEPQRNYLRKFNHVHIIADNDKHGVGQTMGRGIYFQMAALTRANLWTVPEGAKDYTEALKTFGPQFSLTPLKTLAS